MIKRVCNICGEDVKDNTNFVMPIHYKRVVVGYSDMQAFKTTISTENDFNLCEDCKLEIARFIKKLKERKNNDGR